MNPVIVNIGRATFILEEQVLNSIKKLQQLHLCLCVIENAQLLNVNFFSNKYTQITRRYIMIISHHLRIKSDLKYKASAAFPLRQA